MSDSVDTLAPNADRLVGVAEYSTDLTVVAPFSDDVTAIQQQVSRMGRSLGAVSNIGEALHGAVDALFEAGRGNSLVLILIAFNPASDSMEVPSALFRLNVAQVHSVALGLGSIGSAELEQITGDASTVVAGLPIAQLSSVQPTLMSMVDCLCDVQRKFAFSSVVIVLSYSFDVQLTAFAVFAQRHDRWTQFVP